MTYYKIGQGEPLIVLHGNSQNSSNMKKIINRFKDRFEIYAIDSRGHGLTKYEGKEYTLEDMTNDTVEFIEKLNLNNVNIIGYSDGGNIAYRVAIRMQDRISKIILLSPNYSPKGMNKFFMMWLGIASFVLTIFSFIKFVRDVKYRVLLITRDEHTEEEDLRKIKCDTLLIYAGIEIILKDHIESFKNNIEKAQLERVKVSTHLDLFSRTKAIDKIEEFLIKKKPR
ncbi:hypothetical protein HMPREF1092_01724 [Clostridium thermobutyricum]|uniref:AB hydrolase-1 domain-containing protein n=1 Tax=Clostridium thermobutyricum TaxID=29372 RepID=N9Y2T7_9CLOT|nr:alpha/beta hydrolase [Clostridium thermobutyricum]ENZ02489.1 hypothetical protein HMPREF1092_01724 [Clostridium thermobutyricum]